MTPTLDIYFQKKEANISFSSEELLMIKKCENFENLIIKTKQTFLNKILNLFKQKNF